jgi:chromosome segregation ATPase
MAIKSLVGALALMSLGVVGCDQSKAELDSTKQQLQAVTAERDSLKSQLDTTKAQLAAAQQQMDQMKAAQAAPAAQPSGAAAAPAAGEHEHKGEHHASKGEKPPTTEQKQEIKKSKGAM